MNIYLVMAFGGMLGILLHAVKSIWAINKKNPLTKFNQVFKEYWKTEWLSFFVSMFCFAVLLFVASEFVNLNKVDTPDMNEPLKERLLHFKLSNFIKLTSVIMGYFSDSIIYGFLGVTEKNLNTKLAELEIKKP